MNFLTRKFTLAHKYIYKLTETVVHNSLSLSIFVFFEKLIDLALFYIGIDKDKR